jgi:hypothetical protein
MVLTGIPSAFSQQTLDVAMEHFNKFNNVENAWCASDATISLLLPDGNTFWLWGDCIVGPRNSTFDVSNESATMINNAAIIEENGILRAYYEGTWQNASSLIPGEDGDIFWPEHATIENDTIKIFAIRIIFENTGIPGFNFRVGTTHMAYFTYPGMDHIKTEEIRYITDSTMRFGTHVFEKDGYKYIYGKKDTIVDGLKYPVPMLARVVNSVDEPWQFYAGDEKWTYDCSQAKPIGDRPMSESYFVYEKNDKYYLIMHEIWLIGELYILEADKLTGPWNRSSTGGVENKFAVIRPHEKNFTYNLFAHPQFMRGEDILISYNVNHRDFWPIFDDTRNYRARFYWMDVDEAINTSIPDTLDIWDYFVSTQDKVIDQEPEGPHLRSIAQILYVENVKSPMLLEIYGMDGRKYYSSRIMADVMVPMHEFPGAVLIIRLTGQKEPIIHRIFNSH